jgi:hypothetical protein
MIYILYTNLNQFCATNKIYLYSTMNNKVFIISYKNGNEWNKILEKSMNIWKDKGFDPEPIQGYNWGLTNFKKNTLVYRNLLEFVLPIVEMYLEDDTNIEGVLVSEDDASMRLSYDEFKNYKFKDKNMIYRLGYQGFQRNRQYPRGYYCNGFTLTYFPRDTIDNLKYVMNKTRPQHIDGFFSKNMEIDVEVLDSICDELRHISFITGDYRKKMID